MNRLSRGCHKNEQKCSIPRATELSSDQRESDPSSSTSTELGLLSATAWIPLEINKTLQIHSLNPVLSHSKHGVTGLLQDQPQQAFYFTRLLFCFTDLTITAVKLLQVTRNI